MAASLRNGAVALQPAGRVTPEDQELLLAELALIEEAQRVLLRPCRGLS
ncbi:hypothetical protein [Synechococcus sp. LA31]|nr:hypothetical protein [Synechococcus sp. LA31]QVV66764.1 hypothetical protein KJJ24_09735 [Synechococcus sp. LA31]